MMAPLKKRLRSPSPDHDISSPLDVVLKRRRKRDYFDNIPSDEVDFGSEQHWSDGEVSSIPKFIEKRRTRQWERQNAPPLPPYYAPGHNPFGSRPALGESRSQPEISTSSGPHYNINHFADLSPLPRWPFSQSQPDPSRLPMSSSPIRHASPSSSPFRPIGSVRTSDTKVDDIEVDDSEPMDEEEMKREWGEEYAAQNSLLHSLHVSRAGPSSSVRREVPTPRSTATPDQSLLQTPALTSPYTQPSYTHMTPGSAMRTPHPNDLLDSHSKGSLPSYTPWQAPYPPGPTPYRNGPQPSSPYTAPTLHTTPSTNAEDGADGMDIEYTTARQEETPGGRASYEEANRLLAALAFDRRKRWGEQPGGS